MGITCPNRNSAEYKQINAKYKDHLTTTMLIVAWQQMNKSSEIPTLSDMESDFQDAEDIFTVESKGFSKDIVNNLQSLELIKRDGNNYVVVGDSIEKIKAYLAFQNIDPGAAIFDNGKFFLNKAFYNLTTVSKKSRNNKEATHIKPLIQHMNRIFPGVEIKMVTEEEGKKYYDSLPDSAKANVKFSEMNSFYIDGKAYLIEERVTDDMLVEEVLHPFIDAIKAQDPLLFEGLLSESQLLFPELKEDIDNTYTSKRGFTQTDRDLELVTQGLSMVFNKQFKAEATEVYASLFERVLKWLFNLVNKLNSYLTGKKINEPEFTTTSLTIANDGLGGLNYAEDLSSIAKMLNRKDLKFIYNIKTNENKVKYSFSPEKKATYDHIYNMANPLQKTLLEKIFKKPLSSKEKIDELTVSLEDDGEPMVMRDKDHVYKDLQTGEIYKSTTNVINGTPKQMSAYEINRDIGNDFDLIADMIAGGKIKTMSDLDGIQDQFKVLSLEQSKDALGQMIVMVKELIDDGSILIPQVIVHDQSTKIAGTIDLLAITPEGQLKIIDLKASIHSKDGNVYKYGKLNLSTDSLVKMNVIDPSGKSIDKLTRKQKHALQVNLYRRMLENMGLPVDYSDSAATTFHVKVDMDGKGSNQTYKGTFKLEGTQPHPYGQNDYIIDQLIPLNIDALSQETIDEYYSESDVFLEEDVDFEGTQEDDILEEDVSMEGTNEEEYILEDIAPEFDVVTRALKSYQGALVTKIEAIEKVRSSIFMDKDEELLKAGIVNDITEITIALSDTPEERSRLYTELMQGALSQIKKFENYVKDPNNFDKPEFITYVLNFDRFLSTFKGLFELDKEGNLNNTQRKLAFSLQTRAISLIGTRTENGLIDNAIVDFVRSTVKSKSSRNFTEAELDMLMKQANDIGVIEKGGQDIATSSDTLLAIMDKIFKAKKQEMLDKTSILEIRIKDVASRLIKLSDSNDVNAIYDFMLEFDIEGNFTGRYTQKIGQVYYDKLLKLREPLFDEDGRPIQFRDITDLDQAKLTEQGRKDIAFNIKLANDKKTFANFFTATTIGANDQPVDGSFHKFTDEFKQARSKHEVFIPIGDNGYFEKRPDVSEKAYRLYKLKYFEKSGDGNNVYPERIDGKPTGRIIKDNVFFFVKPKYRAIRDDVRIDGESIINPKFQAILDNDTELGKVQREFFDMWNQIYERDLLNKIPRAQRDQMMGHAPLVQGNMTKALRGKDPLAVSMFSKMVEGTKEFWTSTAENRVMIANEKGELVDHLPIMFTGRAKSQAQLDAVDKEIQDIQARARLDREDPNWMSVDEYNEQVKLLRGKRKRINSKPFKNEISRDLATSLLKFAGTVQYFDTMSTVDDTMKAMFKVIGDRTYQPSKGKQLATGIWNKAKAAAGKDGFQPVGKAGLESGVRARAAKWLSMVFYNNDEIQKSVVDKMASSIMNLSSLAYVGLNPFGNLNNYIFGRVTDTMEAVGGRFYSKESLARATFEFNKRAIPSAIQRIAGGSIKGANYEPDKANNKYEALVNLFRMMDELSEQREMVKSPSESFKGKWQIAFRLQDLAEYNVQTKVGIAMIIDTKIRKSSDGPGGESISLYDAFEYDKDTHSVKLKEGYDTIVEYNPKKLDENGNASVYFEREYTDDFRYDLRNKIREVNKQLHGNYAEDDRMAIQSNTLGRLFAQFHKWVIPAFNARFRLEYYDENLGWMEGRYLSFFRMLKYMTGMAVSGEFKKMNAEDFKKSYRGYTSGQDLQTDQKYENYVQNNYRMLGEAGMIFLHYAMGLLFASMFADDEDSSELETRAENLLMYQTDRTWKELITFVPFIGLQQQYQMVKSPIASTRTMGELGQALALTITTPLAMLTGSDESDSSIYYQRGSRAGELKLKKEWMDAIPILYAIKKYQNLIEQQNFYIK